MRFRQGKESTFLFCLGIKSLKKLKDTEIITRCFREINQGMKLDRNINIKENIKNLTI